ncbi:hypothetical protein C8J56DRAFT_900879 [Mycena floridula]|nr:hypothetical protein C8J56DRAFT_900879 [Mycena floridula]
MPRPRRINRRDSVDIHRASMQARYPICPDEDLDDSPADYRVPSPLPDEIEEFFGSWKLIQPRVSYRQPLDAPRHTRLSRRRSQTPMTPAMDRTASSGLPIVFPTEARAKKSTRFSEVVEVEFVAPYDRTAFKKRTKADRLAQIAAENSLKHLEEVYQDYCEEAERKREKARRGSITERTTRAVRSIFHKMV